MGYREEILKAPERTAFASALVCGVVTHAFALTNIMHNYDNLPQMKGGFGTGIPSGRWFLEILKTVFEWLQLDYNLPVLNGLLLIVLLGLAAGFAVSCFQVKNRWCAAGMGMLFVVFPTVTSTMFFKFTAGPDGLGILLAVLAAWVLPKRGGLLLSGLCTALSLGIYQAYTPLTISIFVVQLIQMSLKEDAIFWKVVYQGLYRVAALLAGIVLYYLFLKVLLQVYSQELNNYQGMQSMGQISLSTLPGLIKRAYKDFCLMPFRDYRGLANTPVLKGLYLVMAGICGVMVFSVLMKRRKIATVILTGGLCALLPLAVNFVVVMCPQSHIYTLMLYPFVIVPCMPLILWDQMPEITAPVLTKALCKTTAVVTALVIFLYGYYANVNYSALYYADLQAGEVAASILTQARMTPGFDSEKKWARIGNYDDPMAYFAWEDESFYGGNVTPAALLNGYSWYALFYGYMGVGFPQADSTELQALNAMEEVKAMPCWPDYGSMQVIDDYLVIKFQ